MKLYETKARELGIGTKLDCYHRRFGYYPIEIIEIQGKLFTKDSCDVCSKIPKEGDDIDCFDYDFVVENGGD